MTAHIITPNEYRQMQWKNGRGSTLEVFAVRDDTDFLWRLSIATIEESCPFSNFPDHQRILIPLEGDPVQLQHDGGDPVTIKMLQPYRFDGAAQTACALLGKRAVDFNVMTSKSYGTSDARVASGPFSKTLELKRARHACIYVHRGAASVTVDGYVENLGESCTWMMQSPSGMTQRSAEVTGSSDCIVVMVTVA